MASQVIGFQLVDCGSIALSGTKNVTIPVPTQTNKLLVRVSAKYAAVAATSGLSWTVKVSPDGSTFNASNKAGGSVAPAANVLGQSTFEIGITDNATRVDGGTILDYQLDFTNADATNAVVYAVEYASV